MKCEVCGKEGCWYIASPRVGEREWPPALWSEHCQQVREYIEGLKQPELHWSVFEQGGMFTVSTNCPLPDNANDFFELPRDAVMAVCEHIKSGLKRTEYHPRNEGLKPKAEWYVFNDGEKYLLNLEPSGHPELREKHHCLSPAAADALYSYMRAEREG